MVNDIFNKHWNRFELLNCHTQIVSTHTTPTAKVCFFFPDFFSPFQTTYLQSTKGIYFTRLLKGQVTKKKRSGPFWLPPSGQTEQQTVIYRDTDTRTYNIYAGLWFTAFDGNGKVAYFQWWDLMLTIYWEHFKFQHFTVYTCSKNKVFAPRVSYFCGLLLQAKGNGRELYTRLHTGKNQTSQ